MRLDTCSFFWVLVEVPTWKTKVNDVTLVLLVDDDSSVRESVAEMLAAKGYFILQAENGQDGLDLLKKTPHFPVWSCSIWRCRSWMDASS